MHTDRETATRVILEFPRMPPLLCSGGDYIEIATPQPNPPASTLLPSGTPEGFVLRAVVGTQIRGLQEIQDLGSNSDDEELQEEIGGNLPATINGDDEEQHLVEGQQGQHLSPVSPARPHCCCAVIIKAAVIILPTAAVIALSVPRSLSGKTEQDSSNNTYAVCPRTWIGFQNKCFYFSEDMKNQTSSDNYCMALGAQLAQFDSQEELDFLNRYKGPFDHWIGLHRESSHHPWMWTDNTKYNNLTLIRGVGNHAYLSDRGISSSRDYIPRRWICSQPNSYTLVDSQLV